MSATKVSAPSILHYSFYIFFSAFSSMLTSSILAGNQVNFTDLSLFADKWLHSGCNTTSNFSESSDYEISTTVDAEDITFLKGNWSTSKQRVLSDDIAKLIINLNPDKVWTYDRAFMVQSLYEKWQYCKNPEYLEFVKGWLDPLIAEDGNIKGYDRNDYNLDMIRPGSLCLAMYEKFGDPKYKLAAEKLLVQLINQPVTFDGGYWHKKKYPYQMWLDGIFMAEPFIVQYAKIFNKPQWFARAGFQITLIATHTQDTQLYPGDTKRTGLFYHGWDGSAWETPPKTPKVWADPVKGHSPEFWGRAMGWYAMAVVDCLDYLPADDPYRPNIIKIFNDLSSALADYQDTATGMWWQVIDKGYPRQTYPKNYTESSCTAMLSYAIGKAVEKGYITSDPQYYRNVSRRAFEGLVANKISYDTDGYLRLIDTVKVGSLNGDGDYDYYMSVERIDNDYKGVGALMRAALQYEKTRR